jgi:hypothetical protein
MPDALSREADPFNPWEPVDASAAAIAAQALLRLGHVLYGIKVPSSKESSGKYLMAGLAIVARLCGEPYLSEDPSHEGLLLHAVYHYPNGWDFEREKGRPPFGESCLWGDYHLLEAGLWAWRWLRNEPLPRFFDIEGEKPAGGEDRQPAGGAA